MKKLALVLFLTLGSNLFSQDYQIGETYYFTSSLDYTLTNQVMKFRDSTDLFSYVEMRRNDQIRIEKITNDRIYFSYIGFENDRDQLKYNFNVDTLATKELLKGDSLSSSIKDTLRGSKDIAIFSMTKENFGHYTKKMYARLRGFEYGTYTVPIRLRSNDNNFEFDANLSLGANIISRISLNRYSKYSYVDFSFGVSLSKINLDPSNSLLGVENTDFAEIEKLSPSAITFSTGILLNLAKNVNFGAYVGWDYLSSADQKADWIYNKKPWLGIGINVLLSGDADNTRDGKTQPGESDPKGDS
ncbi:MAG: hypothetical protein WBG71_10340 [Leeuwenhoekiella sp.]